MNLMTPAGQMQMFSETQSWLTAEFRRLRRLKRTTRVMQALRELRVRARQLDQEIEEWLERNT